jgi:hypothetical protein
VVLRGSCVDHNSKSVPLVGPGQSKRKQDHVKMAWGVWRTLGGLASKEEKWINECRTVVT